MFASAQSVCMQCWYYYAISYINSLLSLHSLRACSLFSWAKQDKGFSHVFRKFRICREYIFLIYGRYLDCDFKYLHENRLYIELDTSLLVLGNGVKM